MDLITKRFLILPAVFIAVLFVLDKIFLLPEVRDHFIQPGGMMYYRQRARQVDLYNEFAKNPPPGTKLAVVFGDSRSFAIGNIVSSYIGKKDWTIFNFAGPQAVPAYHDHLSEKIFESGNPPGYMMLGLSPDAFNRNSGLMASPVMNFGVDQEYILKNRTMIPSRDFDTYTESRRFALVGMQFSLKTLIARISGSLRGGESAGLPLEFAPVMQDPNFSDRAKSIFLDMARGNIPTLADYDLDRAPERRILDAGGGAQYYWFGAKTDEDLRRDTDRIVAIYLKSFIVSEEQIYFYTRLMARSKKAGVRSIVFWPRVNPYLRKVYDSEPRIHYLWLRLEKIALESGAIAVDLNHVDETACNQYYDASHLSFSCFPSITKYLINRLEN